MLIQEKKNKLRETTPNEADYRTIRNSASSIFAGLSSAQIKELLGSLTPEEMDNYLYLSGRMNPNSLANIRGVPRESNNEVKNMLEALKIGLEAGRKNDGNGTSAKDLIDAFKAGTEVNKAQQSPVQQQQDPMLVYKTVQEIIHPYQEAANNKEKQLNELRLKEVESRIVDPNAYIKNIKTVAADLGFTQPGATNEMTLRQAEMAQTERLENRKLDFEMKKYDMDASKGDATVELIKEGIKAVTSGPVGELIGTLGKAGAARIRGSTASNSDPSQEISSRIEQAQCPICRGVFPVNTQLPMVQCPLCGTTLKGGNQAVPSQEMPKDQPPSDSAQAQSSPSPVQEKPVDQTVEVEPIVEQPTK